MNGDIRSWIFIYVINCVLNSKLWSNWNLHKTVRKSLYAALRSKKMNVSSTRNTTKIQTFQPKINLKRNADVLYLKWETNISFYRLSGYVCVLYAYGRTQHNVARKKSCLKRMKLCNLQYIHTNLKRMCFVVYLIWAKLSLYAYTESSPETAFNLTLFLFSSAICVYVFVFSIFTRKAKTFYIYKLEINAHAIDCWCGSVRRTLDSMWAKACVSEETYNFDGSFKICSLCGAL